MIQENKTTPVVLLPLNRLTADNSAYDKDDVQSWLNRPHNVARIKNGGMLGEYGRDRLKTLDDITTVSLTDVCARFENIRIEQHDLMADLITCGPKGPLLTDQVFGQNYSIKMRAFTRNYEQTEDNGVALIAKFLVVVIAFDIVLYDHKAPVS
jgi:hypothetical protein